MDHLSRLQLVGRITYYVGWIGLVCGGAVHVNIARNLFLNMGLTQRNLFEVSVVCFLICAATELRALASTGRDMPSVVKKQIAA